MDEEIEKHTCELAMMSQDETDYGRWQDKYIKNRFVCKHLPIRLRGIRCVGIYKALITIKSDNVIIFSPHLILSSMDLEIVGKSA